MQKVIISIIFISLSHYLYCQDTLAIKKWQGSNIAAPSVKQAGIVYSFRKYDMEQGLENPYILRIRQNKNGEILFGTAGNGAGIFDGTKYVFYNTSNGLLNNTVQDCLEDNKGNLWFATTGGGVSKYDGKSFTNFNKTNGLADNSVWVICEDKKGNLWFGTEKGGVSEFDGKTFKNFSVNDGLCSKNIRSIYEDKKGNLWFGSTEQGLSVYDGKNFKNYSTANGLPDDHILSFDEDKNGKIWIASYGGGLCVFENNKFSSYGQNAGLQNMLLCDVLCDKNGVIWVASSGKGMFKFDGKTFLPYSVSEGLSNNVVLSLLEDKNGNIWAGTYGGGICEYTARQFTSLSENEGLPSNLVRSIVKYSDSVLYFTTSGGGFCSYNGKEFKNYSTAQGLSSPFILCSAIDKENNLWLGTSGEGICKFDGKKFYTLTSEQGLKSNYQLSMISGKQGEIYVGHYGGGLSIIKDDKIIHYGKKDSLPAFFINSLAEDEHQIVWIGTETGLYKLENGKIARKFPEIFNKNNPVPTVFCDNKNGLWIGTDGGGVYYLKNNELQNISRKDGLCNNYVKSIIEDEASGIWIGTSNGISYLKPRSVNSNSLRDYAIKNYERSEGYSGSNCFVNAIAIDNQKRIWFGTGRKLICFDPSKEIRNTEPPVVKLEKINLFYENVDWKKYHDSLHVNYTELSSWSGLPLNLSLPYNQNHFTFYFTGINLNCPEKTTYKFLLEGLDKQWSPVSFENRAIYSNIPPGNYTFKVIAFNENGIASETSVPFKFVINAPWWEKLWFRIVAIGSLILFVFLIMKIRERKLVKAKLILENTVRERTSEVVQQKEIVEKKNELIVEKQKEIIDSISYAKRLQQAILPPEKFIKEYLPESFIYYSPKDIVAGDFYWFHVIAGESNAEMVLIAAADCTGHGVPGAMVSVVCSNALNRTVKELKITEPGKILEKVRELVLETFEKSENEVKDGMDISLCSINLKSYEVKWAGANNPLWYTKQIPTLKEDGEVCAEQGDATLHEIKANKQPIGKTDNPTPFMTHQLQLKKGDNLFLFSDGFADQFGGPRGKKFMYKPLKEILFQNSLHSTDQQKELLAKAFEGWKGQLEQVDDVLIIGVRI